MEPLLTWLIQSAVGPAAVGLPVTWAATDLARAARGWFRRFRRSDGLSRIVMAAAEGQAALVDTEFAAIRRLLEQESTWLEVGQGTIEDLAGMIARCLPGRSEQGALVAGKAIAAGLMEFAVRDLEPQWFSQVLFARLDRLQADQASGLDRAILSVHADLVALFAYNKATDAERSGRVLGQLASVLDRLPPGPADHGEVAVYLATLIRWLSTDAWPQDVRFHGPTLSPTSIERRLDVAVPDDRQEKQYVDLWVEQYDDRPGKENNVHNADELARQCLRLVVLGGPGSGKTWLARRTVRLCAEAAMDALAAGYGVDEIELPLFTTCVRLSTTPSSYSIRRAVVVSALSQLPDLGGSRITEAIRTLFEERNAPTLLVADSLDEARGADDRIRQADTLPPAWRIVLTGRPGSWNRQVAIGEEDSLRRVSHLQPLHYPYDVDEFISQWFSGRPERASSLSAQIHTRPALQQAATVPLILAFYCIIGGDEPLPARRADLYAKVIRRMLTGRWRGSSESDLDVQACLKNLRSWAWSAAESHPISGVGVWQDDFLTSRVGRPRDDQDALDHVAVPMGPPDLDSGMRLRRFVHRSLHEHLVAEHVALELSASDAAQELLKHLWYDPDWEYAGPAALAMHPDRGQVLADLLRYVTGSEQLRVDFPSIDDCWQIRLFLARVAQESAESAWPLDASEWIGQARLDLFKSQYYEPDDVVTPHWPTSSGPIMESLLTQLGDQSDYLKASRLAETIAEFYPNEQERSRIRKVLLTKAARTDRSFIDREAAWDHNLRARNSMQAAAKLAPTEGDRAEFQKLLISVIGSHSSNEQSAVSPAQDKVLRFLYREGYWATQAMPEAVTALARTVQDRAQARQALLMLLDSKRRPEVARALAGTVAALDPTPEDLAQVRQALLAMLGRRPDPEVARDLARMIAVLDPTPEDLAEVRQALLDCLRRAPASWAVPMILETAVGLIAGAEDRTQVRQALLAVLGSQQDPQTARDLAQTIAVLDPTPEDLTFGCHILLDMAEQQQGYRAAELAQISGELAMAAGVIQARQFLLTWLENSENVEVVHVLAHKVAQFGLVPEDRTRARKAVLTLLDGQTYNHNIRVLARAISRLSVTVSEQKHLVEVLLIIHDNETDYRAAQRLMETIAEVAITPEDRMHVRRGLFIQLTGRSDPRACGSLARAVARLDPNKAEMAQARRVLLQMLNSRISPGLARYLALTIEMLDPQHEDQAPSRHALLTLLDKQNGSRDARPLINSITMLNPTIDELVGAPYWSFRSDPDLLAAARRNSRLNEWIAFLPVIRPKRS